MSSASLVSFEWLRLTPVLAPVAGLLVVLLLDAALPHRRVPHRIVAIVALLAGAATAMPGALTATQAPVRSLCLPGGPQGTCLWSAGPVASTLQIGILASTLAVLLLLIDRDRADAVDVTLLLAAATGGAAVAASRDLASWLIALELATVPVVALVALRGAARAAHGALSLLMTSLVSFGLLVLGVALWVTATGAPMLAATAVQSAWADPATRPVLVLAVLALIAGLAFKLSAVPFHAWTPIAWSGAPLPVAALLGSASKLSAVAALLALLEPLTPLVGVRPGPHVLAFVLGALAVLSMLVGTVAALRAADAIRLLAWSTVAQGGWVLLPLTALAPAAHRASAAYALTYAAAALVALAAVSAVRGRGPTAYDLSAFTGLARKDPAVGLPLAFALLTLAGLPPGVLGLVVKVAAVRPLLGAGLWPLAVAAVVAVVLGMAVYVRWIAVLLATPDGAGSGPGSGPTTDRRRGAMAVLAIGTALLLVASVVPTVLFGLLG